MVEPIARRVKKMLPPSFQLDDLIQVGRVALLHLATTYRPSQHAGAPFAAYARPRIRGAMLDSVRRRNYQDSTPEPIDHAPEPSHTPAMEEAIDTARLIDQVESAREQLTQLQRYVIARKYSGDDPWFTDIADELGIHEWRVRQAHREAVSILRSTLRAA
jgi:RNA polymerase sigma factor (sigma-70 family)